METIMLPTSIHIEQDTHSTILSYRLLAVLAGRSHRFTISGVNLQDILEKFAKKLFEISEMQRRLPVPH